MELRKRRLDGLFDVVAPRLDDDRGFLYKPFQSTDFEAIGEPRLWKQVIHSHTDKANTVRGIYVQAAPYTEGKMVACLRGRMWWVVVDLRRDSPTFGEWEGSDLGAGDAVLIARGYAHGCLSLADDTDLLLMADNVHPSAEGLGIRWDDSDLGVGWPLLAPAPIISDTHAAYGSFDTFKMTVGGI